MIDADEMKTERTQVTDGRNKWWQVGRDVEVNQSHDVTRGRVSRSEPEISKYPY